MGVHRGAAVLRGRRALKGGPKGDGRTKWSRVHCECMWKGRLDPPCMHPPGEVLLIIILGLVSRGVHFRGVTSGDNDGGGATLLTGDVCCRMG